MKRRIYGIGETVLDIIFRNNQPIAAKPGGSILNCMVSLGRTGLPVSFITELGKDQTGAFILDFLNKNGIDTSFVHCYDDGKTALALAFLNEKNDASYSFYKQYPEIRMTGVQPVFNPGDILFFGSFYGIMKEIRPDVLKMVYQARESGSMVLYDPNFRQSHLHELSVLRPMIIENISLCNILRGSDEDFKLIFNTSSADETYRVTRDLCPYLIYTSSSKAVYLRTPSVSAEFPVKKIIPVSTIGAGDSFNAGLVYGLISRNITVDQLGLLSNDSWAYIIAAGIDFSSDVCLSLDNYISPDFALNYRL